MPVSFEIIVTSPVIWFVFFVLFVTRTSPEHWFVPYLVVSSLLFFCVFFPLLFLLFFLFLEPVHALQACVLSSSSRPSGKMHMRGSLRSGLQAPTIQSNHRENAFVISILQTLPRLSRLVNDLASTRN